MYRLYLGQSVCAVKVCPSLDSERALLALSLSHLSGNVWSGRLALVSIPISQLSLAETESGDILASSVILQNGSADLEWVDSERVLVASDDGSISLETTREMKASAVRLQREQNQTKTSSTKAYELISDAVVESPAESVFNEHEDIVSSLSFNTTTKKFLSSSWDSTIKLWSLEKSASITTFRGNQREVSSVAWSKVQPSSFLSVHEDKTALLWDERTPKSSLSISLPSRSLTISASPTKEHSFLVGTKCHGVIQLDTRNSQFVHHHRGYVGAVGKVLFSNESDEIWASGDDTPSVKAYTTTSVSYTNDNHHDYVRGLSWLPSNISSSRFLVSGSWDKTLIIHSIPSN
eukprot:TRINITY_DN4986_c0_g1_i1.p1 TRINITY_DN4986_c0_g1~~TRINITY_DN4986_c0_g1_i1.p1  ORF type:complete len:365 (+),score=66.76 TRINITY_DN4986_c0_g1_i1:52-1095(+)